MYAGIYPKQARLQFRYDDEGYKKTPRPFIWFKDRLVFSVVQACSNFILLQLISGDDFYLQPRYTILCYSNQVVFGFWESKSKTMAGGQEGLAKEDDCVTKTGRKENVVSLLFPWRI